MASFERADPPRTETEILAAVITMIGDRLPTTWTTGSGRAPAEAGELLSWMGRNEQSWR
ncbi:hypothetical protein NLM24_04785 [Nocardia zapadnayensis]|nr:hypothetical protein [Nocardia zapadnayensis]MCX0270035.1 hypothetical protein [Nocardia zapadnayensis]